MKKPNNKNLSKKENLKTSDNKAKKKLKETTQVVSSLVVMGLAGYLYVNNPDFFQTKNEKYVL